MGDTVSISGSMPKEFGNSFASREIIDAIKNAPGTKFTIDEIVTASNAFRPQGKDAISEEADRMVKVGFVSYHNDSKWRFSHDLDGRYYFKDVSFSNRVWKFSNYFLNTPLRFYP